MEYNVQQAACGTIKQVGRNCAVQWSNLSNMFKLGRISSITSFFASGGLDRCMDGI